jgi:hypothetical protein
VYPPSINARDVAGYFFIRRTDEDIYPYLEKFPKSEVIEKILHAGTPKRDIFVFSVSLYGYYEIEHIKLLPVDSHNKNWTISLPDIQPHKIEYSVTENAYPLFLEASKLFEHSFTFEEESFSVSFWHKPTIANYWHFKLFTQDSEGNHLPRQPKSGERETNKKAKKLRHIALTVFEYLVSTSICNSSKAIKYQTAEFDRIIEPLKET